MAATGSEVGRGMPSASELCSISARVLTSKAGRRGAATSDDSGGCFKEECAAPSSVPATDCRMPARCDVGPTLDMLRRAERPVVIAGSGVWWSGAANSYSA